MAQYNTFFIPHGDAGIQQELLNVFLRSHRVLKVEKGVFPEGWAFCVEWMDGTAGGGSLALPPYAREKVDYMKVLSPEAFARFSELRKRRRQLAEEDGVRPFIIMTDAQLAQLAKVEQPTVADLKKIDGFGEAKAEKYGERLLSPAEEPKMAEEKPSEEGESQP